MCTSLIHSSIPFGHWNFIYSIAELLYVQVAIVYVKEKSRCITNNEMQYILMIQELYWGHVKMPMFDGDDGAWGFPQFL